MIDSRDFHQLQGLTPDDVFAIIDYMRERRRPAREAAKAAKVARQAELDEVNHREGLPTTSEAREQDDEYARSLGLRTGTRSGMWDTVNIVRQNGMTAFAFVAVKATRGRPYEP